MSAHRELERTLERIADQLAEAQQELSTLMNTENIEDDAGALADDLRGICDLAGELLTTDIEDAENAIRELVSRLENACTDANTLYNRF